MLCSPFDERIDGIQGHEFGADESDDDDNASTWSEEVIWSSPLDEFDSYIRFTAVLTCQCYFSSLSSRAESLMIRGFLEAALEVSSPQLFRIATESLDAQERNHLESIGARALAGGEKAIFVPHPVLVPEADLFAQF